MSREEIRRANAEARFKKAEEQAVMGADAKADYDAGIAARDATMKRLRAERLVREEIDRVAPVTRERKP